MKNTNLTLKLACYLIVAALLVWLGIYAYQALNDPYRTVPVTGISIRDSVEVRGIVAREEQVLYSVYSSVRVKLAEGTRVSAGGTVAEAFDSEEAMLQAVRLAELRAEAEELTALLNLGSAESTQQADGEIQSGIRELRQCVYEGDFTAAEAISQTLQTQVFAAFSNPADVRLRLQEIGEEISRLEQQRSGAERSDPITAPVSGLYSSTVDGWEDLGYGQLKEIGADDLRALLREDRSVPAWSLGKLVSGTKWYFAALVNSGDASRISGKKEISVRFGRYYGEELRMRVEWLSPEENGQRALLLSCDEHMSDVLSMRYQEAELVLSEEAGLRIPRKGLHVDDSGQACVYVQTALLVEKKPVRVERDFGDYYLVSSEVLRAGDQVIVSAKNLYEGKVVG
jgi:multidrug efflux pump subunit AcrA (membrane-fusion protein)